MSHIAWSIQRSIVLEVAAAIYYLKQRHLHLDYLESFKSIYLATPTDWLDTLDNLNPLGGKFDSAVEILGTLADTLLGEDYGQASLKMRQLTLSQVRSLLITKASNLGLDVGAAGDGLEDLESMAVKIHRQVYTRFCLVSSGTLHAQYAKDFRLMLSILSGQENHDLFWHWMDRFYYQAYQPWRETRKSILDTRQRQAEVALGASSADTGFPALNWLDSKNVLNRIPELQEAVRQHQLQVVFWVEPFGLADTWLCTPDYAMISFAEPGEIFQHFAAYNQQLANRISALSDPTRLIILRIIRNFGMTNTDMAEFLGISRPTVSIHAKILREAGLIDSTQDGRITRHVIKPEELKRLLRELQEFIDLPIE